VELDVDKIERGQDGKYVPRDEENKSSTKKKKCMIFLSLLLLIGGGVGAALGILLSREKRNNASANSGAGNDATSDNGGSGTNTASSTPESYKKEDVAMEILRDLLPTKSYTALSDPYIDTAQSNAFDFIINDDGFVYDWDGLASTPVDTEAQINFVQRYTAATLYISTQGKNWNNNDGWMGKMNVCTWFGVACDENGIITSLSLSENNLKGPIPADLKTLGSMHTIDMHTNSLNGQLPSSLFEMNELKVLYLDDNSLTGGISDSIGQLTKLEKLTLNDNELTGKFPSAIGSLENLDMLWLYNNPGIVGSIPTEISNCQKLSKFTI
jgi:Leucine-rich repeat (LRR) protein